MSKQVNVKASVTEKMVTIHSFMILFVVVCFGIINIVSKAIVIGILMIILGGAVCATVRLLRDKKDRIFRGTILSLAQCLIIIVMSVAKHELHVMFPLMLASMSIAAIYYSKRCLISHWVMMDAACIVGFFANSFFYGGQSIEILLKGIAGINIGAFLIFYLVKCSLGFIGNAQDATAEADKLLEQVKSQMDETEAIDILGNFRSTV